MLSKIAAHAPRTVTNFMYAFPFYTLCLMPLGPALWINGTIHLFGPGLQAVLRYKDIVSSEQWWCHTKCRVLRNKNQVQSEGWVIVFRVPCAEPWHGTWIVELVTTFPFLRGQPNFTDSLYCDAVTMPMSSPNIEHSSAYENRIDKRRKFLSYLS